MEAEQAGFSSEGRMENMAGRRMMALVEDVEVARTALRSVVHNIFRVGDAITFFHVYCQKVQEQGEAEKTQT